MMDCEEVVSDIICVKICLFNVEAGF